MTLDLDAGTTVQAMRPLLQERRELTVVTYDLGTAGASLDHPSVDLICVGRRHRLGAPRRLREVRALRDVPHGPARRVRCDVTEEALPGEDAAAVRELGPRVVVG